MVAVVVAATAVVVVVVVAILENCIRYSFIPAITNGHKCNDEERLILTLPPRLGGLGIPNPFTSADQEYITTL